MINCRSLDTREIFFRVFIIKSTKSGCNPDSISSKIIVPGCPILSITNKITLIICIVPEDRSEILKDAPFLWMTSTAI